MGNKKRLTKNQKAYQAILDKAEKQGIKIQGLIASFSAAIPIFQGFLAASVSVNVALMNTAASTTGVTSALAGAGAGITSFGATLAAAAPVILATTGIVVSLKVAYEAIKLQLMLNDQAHKDA